MLEIQNNNSAKADQLIKNNVSERMALDNVEGNARNSTDFQKIAGAYFATPTGPKNAPPAPQQKKKRGRPRKYQKQNNQTTTILNANEQQPIDAQQQVAETQPAPVDFSEFINPILKSVSKIPATKYKCKDLELTDDESKQLSASLNAVINVYLPDLERMDPKSAAIFGLTVTAATIFISKIQVLNDRQIENEKAEMKKQLEQQMKSAV